MDETHLYKKIAAAIRQEILSGKCQPGERLPPLRDLADRWECTIGTVQHAYRELVEQGLVVSRPGRGTRVVDKPLILEEAPLRRAALIHQAESFLLEVLTAGYSVPEVEAAMRQALDRWRAVASEPIPAQGGVLRFSGSHDPAMTWLAAHFPELLAGYQLVLNFNGSLGGLIALSKGEADLAGCHLWDEESDAYNLPFVKRILPNKRVALITLAHRHLGLIVPPGNPLKLQRLEDISTPNLRFANRQPGSGTRVWLDAALHKATIDEQKIRGYGNEKLTHFEVARSIAEGEADAGLGLEAAALGFGLGFVPLVLERYDLVIPEAGIKLPEVRALLAWLKKPGAKSTLEALGGYETQMTGEISWVGE